jgi:hypothetical protein
MPKRVWMYVVETGSLCNPGDQPVDAAAGELATSFGNEQSRQIIVARGELAFDDPLLITIDGLMR